MNYKRDVIEKFITQDLPRAIAEELDRGALADQSQAAKELIEVAQKIKETLGKDALDADSNLAKAYHGTPLSKKYQDLKSKAAGGRGREAFEASIFNHLYTFFSRYYQDGDFISKRRYSKRQRYAIPYNGEEVYLYRANNDQYYVKTAEHFHDYTFTSRGVTVHFKLQAASVEQNNVKGDKRFLLPRVKETEWDEDTGQLVILSEYRALTEQEEITYGRKNQQEAIIADALADIPKRLKKVDKALVALTTERYLSAPQSKATRQAGRQIVVIWRETEGWQKANLERDKKFVAERKLTEGADEGFINGDSFIPNAKALEPVFKARMFAPVEV